MSVTLSHLAQVTALFPAKKTEYRLYVDDIRTAFSFVTVTLESSDIISRIGYCTNRFTSDDASYILI